MPGPPSRWVIAGAEGCPPQTSFPWIIGAAIENEVGLAGVWATLSTNLPMTGPPASRELDAFRGRGGWEGGGAHIVVPFVHPCTASTF